MGAGFLGHRHHCHAGVAVLGVVVVADTIKCKQYKDGGFSLEVDLGCGVFVLEPAPVLSFCVIDSPSNRIARIVLKRRLLAPYGLPMSCYLVRAGDQIVFNLSDCDEKIRRIDVIPV